MPLLCYLSISNYTDFDYYVWVIIFCFAWCKSLMFDMVLLWALGCFGGLSGSPPAVG